LDISSALEMTKVWSGKEALYKIAGRKGILFSKELHLSPIENNRRNGRIHSGDKILHAEISIFTLDDVVVSVNINALKEE
jgi:4'-phosphopantetheinyl transferase